MSSYDLTKYLCPSVLCPVRALSGAFPVSSHMALSSVRALASVLSYCLSLSVPLSVPLPASRHIWPWSRPDHTVRCPSWFPVMWPISMVHRSVFLSCIPCLRPIRSFTMRHFKPSVSAFFGHCSFGLKCILVDFLLFIYGIRPWRIRSQMAIGILKERLNKIRTEGKTESILLC